MTKARNSKELISESVQDSVFWNIHDNHKGKTLEELQKIQNEQTLPFAVCVLNLTGDLNVGMITRTACIFGAKEVIIFGRRKYDKRSTVGAQNYVPVTRVDGFEDKWTTDLSYNKFIELMKQKSYLPIFVEQGGKDITEAGWMAWLDALYSSEDDEGNPVEWKTPCLVFGNENEGIPAEFLKVGVTISVGQRGVLRSLNVSAAAAIVIHYFAEVMNRCEDARTHYLKHFED